MYDVDKKIWLMDESGWHVEIPIIAAIDFIERTMGANKALVTLQECAIARKKLANEKILNRNFLTWIPSTSKVIQCEFKRHIAPDGLAMTFPDNATNEIFKAIDGEHAHMVIYVSVDNCNDLTFIGKNMFGISDAYLIKNPIYPGDIIESYHKHVSAVKYGVDNPTLRPKMSATMVEYTMLANIVNQFS